MCVCFPLPYHNLADASFCNYHGLQYPVRGGAFTGAHHVAGLRVLEPEEYGGDPAAGAAAAERELKQLLEGLAQHLFGSGTEVRLPFVCHSISYM